MAPNQCDQPHVFFDFLTSFPYSGMSKRFFPDIRLPTYLSQGQQLFLDPSTSPSSTLVDIMDVHTHPDATDTNLNNFDRVTLLERSIFSDFLCCGLRLADFHALLEHFEEDHIIVVTPNGKRIYPLGGLSAVALHPRSHSLASTPPPSPSLSMVSSPPPPPSPSPASISTLLSPKSSIAIPENKDRDDQSGKAPCPPTVYTPFMPCAAGDPPKTGGIISALEADYDLPHHTAYYPGGPSPSPFNTDLGDDVISDGGTLNSPTNSIPTYVFGPEKTEPTRPSPTKRRESITLLKGIIKRRSPTPRVDPEKRVGKDGDIGLRLALGTVPPVLGNNHRTRVGSQGICRKRDKAYRCPQPRCSKSYLNPNGLKYHLEKGTCKINDPSALDIDTLLTPTPVGILGKSSIDDNASTSTPIVPPLVPHAFETNLDLNHQGQLNANPSSSTYDSSSAPGAPSCHRRPTPTISPVPLRYQAPLWSEHQNQVSRSALAQCI